MLDTLMTLFRVELTTDSVLVEVKWIVPLVVIVAVMLINKLRRLKK